MDVNVDSVDVFNYHFSFFSWQKQAVLARRLLNGELEPSTILNMSPDELRVWSLSSLIYGWFNIV